MEDHQFLSLRIECTHFFQSNPFTFETVDGLAVRLGRKADHLLPALKYLVDRAILEEADAAGQPIFRYVQPKVGDGVNVQWTNL